MPKTTTGPWRAAIDWYLAVLLFGSLAATAVVTVPFLAFTILAYDLPPQDPSWATLRAVQIVQSFVIAGAGGWLALYFRRRIDITYDAMRFQLKALAVAVPLSCLALVAILSIPRYGVTPALAGTAILIFGSFTVVFLAGSFLFARRLTGR